MTVMMLKKIFLFIVVAFSLYSHINYDIYVLATSRQTSNNNAKNTIKLTCFIITIIIIIVGNIDSKVFAIARVDVDVCSVFDEENFCKTQTYQVHRKHKCSWKKQFDECSIMNT